MDPSEAAWAAKFSAVVPTDYHHEFGLEKAYRDNADAWGYNLSEAEQDIEYEGETLKGRVFSKAGTVVWHPAQGAIVVGW